MDNRWLAVGLLCLIALATVNAAKDDAPKVDDDLGKSRDGSRTDDEAVEREEEAIKLDGLNVAQMKELREKAEKHDFQAEVSRMMKLIINSLYKNKEIFLRELISNSSDALDKLRLTSLTNPDILSATPEFAVRIKADKENHVLHVIDTGIGMTKAELIGNLGTIARSGTSEFLEKIMQADSAHQAEMIGQFGVGFYSSFLVADKVVVTSKHNDDKQYIWESDANSFTIVEDPRGTTLKRGTQISLHLKEEAHDFLEPNTLKDLVKKYSQFINFHIYMWTSKTEKVEEPIEEEEPKEETAKTGDETEEEAKVEEEKEEKPKTKTVDKTTWDWELINDTKPVWMRKPDEVEAKDYNEFYKSISKDSEDPLTSTHFKAEGEVAFTSILYVPKRLPYDMFTNYGKQIDSIKLYVRRVFITDDFSEMMPKYLSFVRGIVDSDDLPLNVSRETLQQNKLLKVIQRKLVRKVLDMIKKMDKTQFDEFWKEYSTNIKLGVMEDQSNKTRLSKLLRFYSSHDSEKQTSLSDYVERMKEKQDAIYYMCGAGKKEVESSPFVERLLKKGYEVLYCTEPVDEYCFQAMPDYDGKKLQNVAKEGLDIDKSDAAKDASKKIGEEYKPLTDWLKEEGLKDQIEKAVVSQRLTKSPCALVASNYGWSGHMERIMSSQAYAKANDPTHTFYRDQKKTLEVNPRHPVIKELLRRITADKDDTVAKETAQMLFDTATLRSGFGVKDQVGFAERIESVLRKTLDLSADEAIEDEPELEEDIGGGKEDMPEMPDMDDDDEKPEKDEL